MSLVDTQTSIEYMYSKRRIGMMIRKDIEDTSLLMERISKCLNMLESIYLMGPHFTQKGNYLAEVTVDQLENIIYRILEVTMITNQSCTFSALVGQAASSGPSSELMINFKIVSSVIAYMTFTGLLKLIRAGDANSGMMELLPVFICDKRISEYAHQAMYLPPMICNPKKLTNNADSGYLTIEYDSLILKGFNHHDGDICLDSLNKFNSVPLSLDIQMLTTFDEQPKKLIDTTEKQKQFDKLRKDSYAVYKLLIQSGNNFHLTHKVDKRGRTYAQGYHCSSQGNSFRKSILNLANEEFVHGAFN